VTICYHENMSSNFVVYVDFDSTLFNTRQFSADLRKVIASKARLPFDQVAADAAHFRPHRLGGYDFVAHVCSYGLDPEDMWQQLDTLARSRDYLYPDAAPFIAALRADGFDPKILSFGEERFQRIKIVPTLPTLTHQTDTQALAYTVVFEPKNGHIAALHPGEQGVLVDDVADQKLPAGFSEIHLDRSQPETTLLQTSEGYIAGSLATAHQAIVALTAK
jgi:hypothetical protein